MIGVDNNGCDEYLGFMKKENWLKYPGADVKFLIEFDGPDTKLHVVDHGGIVTKTELDLNQDNFDKVRKMSETIFAILPRKKIPC